MNAVVRTALRTAMNEGWDVVGVRDGFEGLRKGDFWDLKWMDVQTWNSLGGSELGAMRYQVQPDDLPRIARTLQEWDIHGMIAVGGLNTYEQVQFLVSARDEYPVLRIPILCAPASIDNNLPGTQVAIGADTALNNIVDAVDKIRSTAGTAHQAFIVEVMGRRCGYLALESGIATGAEMELLPEDNATVETLLQDVEQLREGFQRGKKLSMVVMSEDAFRYYDTDFVRRVMEAEADGAFEVRTAVLGHLQRGGVPTAFDRVEGSRLGAHAARQIMSDISTGRTDANVIGIVDQEVVITPFAEAMAQVDWENWRPREQSWLKWRALADTLAKPGPGWRKES
jgi:6-phosphofructokinase 1